MNTYFFFLKLFFFFYSVHISVGHIICYIKPYKILTLGQLVLQSPFCESMWLQSLEFLESTNVLLKECIKQMQHQRHWGALLSYFLSDWEPARPPTFTVFCHWVLQWSTTTVVWQMYECLRVGVEENKGVWFLKLQSSIHPWWLLESPITHQQNVIAQFSSSLESYQYGWGRRQETQPWPSWSESLQDKHSRCTPSIQPMFHNKHSSVIRILYMSPKNN